MHVFYIFIMSYYVFENVNESIIEGNTMYIICIMSSGTKNGYFYHKTFIEMDKGLVFVMIM